MKKGSLLIFMLALMCMGCEETSKPKPTGFFTHSVLNKYAPAQVIFEARYTDADNYTWDFGDETMAEGKVVRHEYMSGGPIIVTLTTKGAGGEQVETQTISVPYKSSKMTITKVDVINFPARNSFKGRWDIFSEPDLFLVVKTINGAKQWMSSKYYKNCIVGNNYSFDLNFEITDFSGMLQLLCYDLDSLGYEYSGDIIGAATDFNSTEHIISFGADSLIGELVSLTLASLDTLRLTGYPEYFDFKFRESEFKAHVNWEN